MHYEAHQRRILTVIDSIYEVIGLVNRKIAHVSFRSGKTVKGARWAFIGTLDSLSRSFTIERRNEAKRSSVKLRSIVEGVCFSGSVSSLRWKLNGNPETHLFTLFLHFCIAASTKRLARNLQGLNTFGPTQPSIRPQLRP